jgi:DNA-directed RNA polymerase sigma subunit (sigma70/sigma32)
MTNREIPADVAEVLTAVRQREQAARKRYEQQRCEALRGAVQTLTGQGWARGEVIAALAAQDWSLTAIGEALGVTKQRIDQLLKPAPKDPKRAEFRAAAEVLAQQGLPHSDIAAKLGTSRQKVTQVLRLPA